MRKYLLRLIRNSLQMIKAIAHDFMVMKKRMVFIWLLFMPRVRNLISVTLDNPVTIIFSQSSNIP